MKISVIGSGAMGSIYAGFLANAGNEVTAVDLWKEHIDAIKNNGLHIENASGTHIVKNLTAKYGLDEVDVSDLYILATKSKDIEFAAQSINQHMGPNSILLSIQNGIGAKEKLLKYINRKNILLGVAEGFGASIKKPGCVAHAAMRLIRIGEINGEITPRLMRLARLWRAAGFNVKVFKNIDQLIWEKLICNVTFSAPCSVFDYNIYELMRKKECWEIALACAQEAFDIAHAKKIQLRFKNLKLYVTKFGRKLGKSSPSMRQDYMAGKFTEIDSINGMIEVFGKKHGIRTPYNQVLSSIIRSKELKISRKS